MRDGSTHRRSTSLQETLWTPERVQVDDWRRHGRLDDLRTLAEGANGLTWSYGLLHALLEELHISDDFDVLVGRVARLPAREYPRLLSSDTQTTQRPGGRRHGAAARTPLSEPRTR
jgi:hypothetical protein